MAGLNLTNPFVGGLMCVHGHMDACVLADGPEGANSLELDIGSCNSPHVVLGTKPTSSLQVLTAEPPLQPPGVALFCFSFCFSSHILL